MKKEDILKGYAIVNDAKLTKLDDIAKFKVIKDCKVMRPIVEDLRAFAADAQKKLEGEGHDKYQAIFAEWHNNGRQKPTDEEVEAIMYVGEYNAKVEECMKEELDKEVESWEKLSEEELKKFVASNDWNVAQTIAVMTLFE